MNCFLKRALPFALTLSLGMTLGGLIAHNDLLPGTAMIETRGSVMTLFSNVSELDFPDAARRTSGFSGALRLRAVLNADGKVSEVEPIAMLPYGVTDISSVETGRMGRPTPAIMDGIFVKTLPYGLTETAIEAAKQIQVEPAIKDGRPISVSVTITYEFNLITSPDCIRCSSITTTVRDDSGGIKWRTTAWLENAYGSRFNSTAITPGCG